MIRNPKISVIVPTMRVGGLDVLKTGLRHQTLPAPDWELVFVDCIKPFRDRDVRPAGFFGSSDAGHLTQVLSVEPWGNRFPLNQYCRAMNTGIRAARGEICLFLVDYTYLPPDCLQRHVNLHEANKNTVVMAPHKTYECPKVSDHFQVYRESMEHYTFSGTDRYVDDLRSGLLNGCATSIFEKPITQPFDIEILPESDRTIFGHDPKVEKPAGECDHLLFYCRNESVRREHLLAINGFDENLDGSHGYQDNYIADALKTKLDLTFINDPENVAIIVNPRRYFPHAKRDRSIEDNKRVWDKLKSIGYPNAAGIAQLP